MTPSETKFQITFIVKIIKKKWHRPCSFEEESLFIGLIPDTDLNHV
jgi:hypothetical protein